MFISILLIVKLVDIINSSIIILIYTILFIIVDIIFYIYLIKKGTKDFNNLSI